MAQLPPMMDYDIRHGRTYMYFEQGHWGQPLYPFGYGLSYTNFRYDHIRLSAPAMAEDGAVTVSLDVTNTGQMAGDAVPQLYVQHLKSAVVRPERELEGFQRVHLNPGETKTVKIPLKAAQLAYWNIKTQAFKVEREPVRLLIGNASDHILLTAQLNVK